MKSVRATGTQKVYQTVRSSQFMTIPRIPHISHFDDVMTLSDAEGHGLVHKRELMKDINFFMKLS
jgi:hypothetical protein